MSEKVAQAIADMAAATENNPEARAFLSGLAQGLTYNRPADQVAGDDAEPEAEAEG